jgi:uncharacterized protein GlcG (DUF336 family)
VSRWLTVGSTVAFLVIATPSRIVAQGTLAPPPQIPYGLAISTEIAKSVAAAAIVEARRHGWTMAIAIVDPGGYLFQDAVAAGGDGLRVLRLTGTIPNEGGIPIVADGKVIGAIGVSGGSVDQDGEVARAGAATVK